MSQFMFSGLALEGVGVAYAVAWEWIRGKQTRSRDVLGGASLRGLCAGYSYYHVVLSGISGKQTRPVMPAGGCF